jgi:hypothetical protein
LPMLNRDGSKGWPRILRKKTMLIVTIYDPDSVPVPKDVMMLKVTGLPILIRPMMTAKTNMTMTALTGTPKPGRTAEIQEEKGRARSRANAKSWRDAKCRGCRR